MTELSNKSVLITGASRGIGAATTQHLAEMGANVVLSARSTSAIEELSQQLNVDGLNTAAIQCDVTNYDQVEAAVQYCIDQFGSLDVLVNNAGVIDPIARLANSDPKLWSLAIDINVKGVYHGLRAAIPVMEAQGKGTIINLSSGAAYSALEGWSHYCASKAAAKRLTECAHKEYADKGIRVIGLSPGTVSTDMMRTIKDSGVNPVSQLDWSTHIPPEWPARAIAYLCTEDAARFAGEDFSIKTDEGRRLVGLTS